ncbi:hypothetical protein ACWGJ2_13785 [Streptomyces sp. NPDC054796]
MSENSTNRPEGTTVPAGDPSAVAQEVEELERRSQTAARLFDVRRIIGGLFVVYGVIVTIAGIFASDADIKKAQDININLWTGLGMLALGVFFLVWLRLSPTIPPPSAENEGEGGAAKEG